MGMFNPTDVALQTNKWLKDGPYRTLTACAAQDDNVLSSILTIAYLASLQLEEGRIVKFGLVLRSPQDPASDVIRTVLEQPLVLTVETIRRLAPAASLPSSMIAIEVRDGDVAIWGITNVGLGLDEYDRGERTSTRADAHLVIAVTGPGTIALKCGFTTLFETERGETARAPLNALKRGPVHDFFVPAMSASIEDSFTDPTLPRGESPVLRFGKEYLRFLVRTLRRAQRGGHGGTILMVPSKSEVACLDCLSIKYRAEGPGLWTALANYVTCVARELVLHGGVDGSKAPEREDLDRWLASVRELEGAEIQMSDCAEFLASLTQVDGAVVMTDQLRVLGFGAVIKNVPTKPWIKTCDNELGHVLSDTPGSSFGTRHRSAAGFCDCVDSVALVLSQDGGVKAFRKLGDEVLMWPSLELGPSSWAISSEDVLRERFAQFAAPQQC